jgi:outer membrane protein assembly factor BamB
LRLIRSLAIVIAIATWAAPAAGRAGTALDWSAYLFGPAHHSLSPATAITPANAASLHVAWHWTPPPATSGQPPAVLYSSPTVASGKVFIGSNTGVFYALNEATGSELWHRTLGSMGTSMCPAFGIVSTATVAPDPSPSRQGLQTVYVAGGNGYLYALDAVTGNVVWRTLVPPSLSQQNYFNWSSPTVVNGHVYLGLSSNCDKPLVRGGVKEFDQASGTLLHSYWSMPIGDIGASVWTSVAANSDGSKIYVTTGNPESASAPQGDSYSIVRLDGNTMTKIDKWTTPPNASGADTDFGASPTLYTTPVQGVNTQLVAACNKNGILYAWRSGNLSAGPLWQRRMEPQAVNEEDIFCLPAPVFDGNAIYQAGGPTMVNGVSVKGFVRKLNPATGAVIWGRGLGGTVWGSASIDKAGVLAVATYDTSTGATNGTYLINASTGAVITRISVSGAKEFAQPVFADSYLFLGTARGGLYAYQP